MTIVRYGTISGSATAIRDAIARQGVQVTDCDLSEWTRRFELLPAHAIGTLQARTRHSIVKTAVWSVATERYASRHLLATAPQPLLFVGTGPAWCDLGSIRYYVYTDRPFREGAGIGAGGFPQRATRSWAERESRFLRGADRVFSFGPSSLKWLVEGYGIDEARVAFVGAGPNSPIGAMSAESTSFDEQTSNPTPTRRLLFLRAGRTRWKLSGGPELLVAFRDLQARGSSVELTIAGMNNGQHTPGVVVAGPVPRSEVSRLMREADIYVRPTREDAFPIAIIEALLHGVPCVGTQVGNQEWMIGTAGVCVPPGDPSALADALEHVLKDYERFQAEVPLQLERVRAFFDWDSTASRILSSIAEDE